MVIKEDNIRRGNNIRILREYFGETQNELRDALIKAKLIKKSNSSKSGQISNYERGNREIKIDILKFIVERYHIDYDKIIDGNLEFLEKKTL